jgi:hypothetical protein
VPTLLNCTPGCPQATIPAGIEILFAAKSYNFIPGNLRGHGEVVSELHWKGPRTMHMMRLQIM